METRVKEKRKKKKVRNGEKINKQANKKAMT